MIIKTRHKSGPGATGIQENFSAAHSDFFDGFQAIGNEGRADDEQLSDAVLGEADEFLVGIRLQPRLRNDTAASATFNSPTSLARPMDHGLFQKRAGVAGVAVEVSVFGVNV